MGTSTLGTDGGLHNKMVEVRCYFLYTASLLIEEAFMSEIVKICKEHGELTLEQTRKDGDKRRCKACRQKSNNYSYYKHREKRVATSTRWKQQNRGDYNEWCREDRKKFPEKYRKYEKNYVEKHGIEKLRKYEVARIHGLTLEEYDALIISHDNVCATCKKPETRLGRDGKTVTPLCVDHCHICEERGHHVIRGLLCRSCNTSLGHLCDDIDTIRNLINYLESHQHIDNTKDGLTLRHKNE